MINRASHSTIFLLLVYSFPLLGHDEFAPEELMDRKFRNSYELDVPLEIELGKTGSIEFTVRPDFSGAEINEGIADIKKLRPGLQQSNLCLFAKIDSIDTNTGFILKEITKPHQDLLPYSQNRWSWQIKGLETGEYLVSLTLSVCTSESDAPLIATLVSVSRKISVVSAPRYQSAMVSLFFAIGLGAVLWRLWPGKFFNRLLKSQKSYPTQKITGSQNLIFISYSKLDEKKILPVKIELEEMGYEVWIDQSDITMASTWREEIVSAISRSALVVFFASRNSYHSQNVSKELAIASNERRTILPIKIDDSNPIGAIRFVITGLQRINGNNLIPRDIALKIAHVATQSNCEQKKPPSAKTSLV